MTLIQRTRFGDILKLLAGWRGATPAGDLAEQLIPTIRADEFDGLTDDGTLYWASLSFTNPAVAAQFSSIGVALNDSLLGRSVRAVVDGFYLRFGAPNAGVVNVGLVNITPIAGNFTQSGCGVTNNFLNGRIVSGGSSQSTNALVTINRANAVSVFSVLGNSMQNTFDNTLGVYQFPQGRVPLTWTLSPGWSFVMEPSGVNTQISGFCWGRFLGDQT